MNSMKSVLDNIVYFIHRHKGVWQAEETLPALAAQKDYIYKLPANFEDLAVEFRHFFEDIVASKPVLPVRHIYKVMDANVSWHGAVFRDFQLFIPSLFYPGVIEQYTDSFLLKQWVGKHICSNSVVAVVHNQFSAINYFHWIIESLPKLLVIKNHFPSCKLALPNPPPEYITTTASLLGFSEFVLIGQNEILKAPQIILAEATLADGHQDPILMRRVKEELLLSFSIKSSVRYRKVYVSRARQRMRRVVNEHQVVDLLIGNGFEEIFFEELTFSEQVQLMAETAVLIGVHGANLTNILFLHPGVRVIELINKEAPNLVYYRMASYLDLEYYSIPCQPETSEETENNADLIVDMTLLKAIIQKVV